MANQISEIEQRLLVDRFLVSGETKAKFARQYDLPFSTMSHYIKKYAPEAIRPKFTEKIRADLVNEFLASEHPLIDFAELHKIAESTFLRWLNEYDPDGRGRAERKKRLGYKPRRGATSQGTKLKWLDEYLESDLTIREFAALKGVSFSTVKRLLKEFDPGAKKRRIKIEKMGYSKKRNKAEKIALAEEYRSSGLSVIEFAKTKSLNRGYIYKCLNLLS